MLLTRFAVGENCDANVCGIEFVEGREYVGEVTPRCHVAVEVVLELRGEKGVVAARNPERGKKPLEPAHPLLRMRALTAQIGVVLLLLERSPEPQKLVEVVIGGVGAPPGDRVTQRGGGSGAVVDERVVEVEDDMADLRARHLPRLALCSRNTLTRQRSGMSPELGSSPFGRVVDDAKVDETAVALLEARWRIGDIAVTDLHEIANELLAAVEPTKALIELFALNPDALRWEGSTVFEQVLDELGAQPTTEAEAAKVIARDIARQLLAGSITPAEATSRGARLYYRTGYEHDCFASLHMLNEGEMGYIDKDGNAHYGSAAIETLATELLADTDQAME